jgi:hypothetical protein
MPSVTCLGADLATLPLQASSREAVARDGAEAEGSVASVVRRRSLFGCGSRVLDPGRLHRSFLAKRGRSDSDRVSMPFQRRLLDHGGSGPPE